MEKLETYNRVPTLESQFIRQFLTIGYSVLIFAAVLGFSSYLLLSKPWPHTLLVSATTLVICLLVNNYDHYRPKHCRYCGSPLRLVVRPLLLTQKYLSMEGRKVGNYFYTRRKPGLLSDPCWVKLSNQSMACHHCRLTEEKYREIQEIPSAEELRTLPTNR